MSLAPRPSNAYAPPRPRAARKDRPQFRLHGPGAPGRARVEAFIAGIYGERYGATIPAWMPWLASLVDGESTIAAAGYRRASQPLFLERYLVAPVHETLSSRAGVRIARDAIFEVGHFAAARAGAGRSLMAALARHLAELGCDWVVSTATVELRALLRRTGIRALPLATAHPGAVGHEAACWGSYYAHSPMVIAGELAESLAFLERFA